MMLAFFCIYILICLFSVTYTVGGNKEYLSIHQTKNIKGIFIVLVFFSHFNSYVDYLSIFDVKYETIVGLFGQTMVTAFMFYSGYGIAEKIKSKGESYINVMPKRRILKTLVSFNGALVLYLLLGICIGNSYSWKDILLSMLGWNSLGNSNWYIFSILVLYIITYIAAKIGFHFDDRRITFVCFGMMFTGFFVFLMKTKQIWWYDTLFCYVFGLIYSDNKSFFERQFMNDTIKWALTLIMIVGIVLFLKINNCFGTILLNIIVNLLFVFGVILFTMRIKINNQFLNMCGDYLFEIYILQRIPMILFSYFGLNENRLYLFFVVCVIFTWVIIKPFRKLLGWCWNNVFLN